MRFTITDNPGLVPQSSLNVGLGHAFLRHIERCSALVYVVDLSSEDPVGALKALRTELSEYAKLKGLEGELESRIRGVVGNKADLFGDRSEAELAELDEDPTRRASAEEGMRKLNEVRTYVEEMAREEVHRGVRDPEDEKVWVVPLSAKRRENVASLVAKLAETVKKEREITAQLAEEEERMLEEERLEAVERLAEARSRR